MENINWDVFTPEEREGIEKLLEMRMPEHIASSILNMTGEKEVEIQKIVAQISPLTDLNEEQLRSKIIEDYYKKNSKGPQTIEEEAELQKQLDEELTKYHEEKRKKANLQSSNEDNSK